MNDGNSAEDLRNDKKSDKIAFERFISDDDQFMELSSGDDVEGFGDEWEDHLLTIPEKIETAIKRQMTLYKRKSEILSRLMEEEAALKKKRRIMKAAKKKADEANSHKEIRTLINADLAFVSEARKKCNEMIVHEKTEMAKIGAVITTLKSLL
jgi:uncharacterized radical SAM superfamily Fe-S cluster-containing enzyme